MHAAKYLDYEVDCCLPQPVVPPVKALPESRTCPNLSTTATRPKSHSAPRTEKSAEEKRIDKLLKTVADGDVEMVNVLHGFVDSTHYSLCSLAPVCLER